MHIVLLAPPWTPVPPEGYGGIELVVALLANELRGRGHRVTLYAMEESERAIGCAPREWAADLGGPVHEDRELSYLARVTGFLRQLDRVDLIHDHSGMAGLLCLEALGRAPVVHTVHGPIGEPQRLFYMAMSGRAGIVAISEAQRRSAPELPWIGTVHNAVDVSNLRVGSREEREDYLLVLARICEDKGQHIAIEVARRAGRRLIMAGKVEETAAARAFYEERVRPAIDGERVVHLTNVAGAEKADLLARAHALLAPITWPEPFGLFMVEAMASGTPVVALASGAAPELVTPGVTGALATGPECLLSALRAVEGLDPLTCAEEARLRFSPAAMAAGYLEVCERALEAAA